MSKKRLTIRARCYFVVIFFIVLGFCFHSIGLAKDRDLSISPQSASSAQAAPPPRQQDYVQGDYWALLIGIDGYENWDSLTTAVADASAIRKILLDNYGFPEQKIVFLKDREANRQNILKEFRRLVELMQENDNLFIYYAGHGYLDKLLNVGYWVPYDGKAMDISTFIPNSTIHDLVRAAKSRHIYLVSDSCFSGTLFLRSASPLPATIDDQYIKKYGKLKSRQALTSGNMEPVSDSGYENHSIFAYYFIKALTDNEDPYLTPMGIFEKIKAPMARNADQVPICKPLQDAQDEGGEFIFANLKFKNSLEKPDSPDASQQVLQQGLNFELENQKIQKEVEQLESQKKQLEQLRKILLDKKALINEQQGIAEEKKKIEQQIKEIQVKQEAIKQEPLETINQEAIEAIKQKSIIDKQGIIDKQNMEKQGTITGKPNQGTQKAIIDKQSVVKQEAIVDKQIVGKQETITGKQLVEKHEEKDKREERKEEKTKQKIRVPSFSF